METGLGNGENTRRLCFPIASPPVQLGWGFQRSHLYPAAMQALPMHSALGGCSAGFQIQHLHSTIVVHKNPSKGILC